jgi:DNA-binding transcriptional LysR family regulator
VSQPAITREIRKPEDRLGLALFDRLPRGVRLTDAGTMLLRYAEQIFSLADAAEWELKELAGLSAGRLTVGASAMLGVYFLPELIARFHSAHPQVEVDLVVANKERVEAGLREHAKDFETSKHPGRLCRIFRANAACGKKPCRQVDMT